jgi:alpha-beta hydrolase superfamily lysophospholipase
MGHLFRRFAHQGIRVYGFDRKGQGMSKGQRFAKDDRLYHNQWEFIDQIGFLKGFQKNIPKFVLGMGYGGLIATKLIQSRNDYFTGAILVNPCYTFP